MSENIMYKNIADKMKKAMENKSYIEVVLEEQSKTIKELKADNQELQDSITWWNNRYNALQRDYEKLKRENERLKKLLDCKERLTKIMPENTEFIILTKADYERQEKDIELALIDYKSRCEKAVEILGNYKHLTSPTEEQAKEQEDIVDSAYDILNGRSDK